MASLNRARYDIVLGDGWKDYCAEPVPCSNMLGTVTVGDQTGALVRHVSDGSYTLVRPGFIMSLVLRKVEAAIDARRAA